MNYNDLYHFGVLGMKWGVRKKRESSSNGRVTRSTKRKAKKDAKEFARAKMFYGEGAGNRRKLINATVNERSKRLHGYKAEFNKHLKAQDMSKHASAAKKERARKDVKKTTAKTARGLVHSALGNVGKASAAAATLYGIGHITGVNKIIAEQASIKFKNVKMWYDMSKKARG